MNNSRMCQSIPIDIKISLCIPGFGINLHIYVYLIMSISFHITIEKSCTESPVFFQSVHPARML